MRKKNLEIKNLSEIENIIRKSKICRLGFYDGLYPYIVPVCFGYKNKTIFFHSAAEGKKIDILKKNPNVCFEFDFPGRIKKSKDHCTWDIDYKSVIGFGKARFIKDIDLKINALKIIIQHYTKDIPTFQKESLRNTAVIKIIINNMTGKTSS